MASSMSWLMYATRSTSARCAPRASPAAVGPVWLRMPSRASCVRFRPRPSRSRRSTMRSECWLWRKRGRCAPAARRRGPPRRRVRTAGGRGRGRARRLRQVLVEPQGARDRARDADDLERVREPGAVVVALGRDEDLGLVLQAAEGLGVDDAVAVALERRAQGARLLRRQPSARAVAAHGQGAERDLLGGAQALCETPRHRPRAGLAAHAGRVAARASRPRRSRPSPSSSTPGRTRSTSATDQAWNGQPVAACGASPSAVSDTEPSPHSARCSSSPSRTPAMSTPQARAAST